MNKLHFACLKKKIYIYIFILLFIKYFNIINDINIIIGQHLSLLLFRSVGVG